MVITLRELQSFSTTFSIIPVADFKAFVTTIYRLFFTRKSFLQVREMVGSAGVGGFVRTFIF
jgi:hypothetical protein